LQPDHVNEPDFDGKLAEGENGVSDSAILSVRYKKLHQDSRRSLRAGDALQKRNKITRDFASNKISILSG
jgi:hypothetical protein